MSENYSEIQTFYPRGYITNEDKKSSDFQNRVTYLPKGRESPSLETLFMRQGKSRNEFKQMKIYADV